MVKRSQLTIQHRSWVLRLPLLALLSLLLSNCGDGGKARYEYADLSEDQVLDQFAKAKTPEKRESLVARIRSGGVTANFSYGKLWANPRAAEMCQNLDSDSVRLLLGTADESCSTEDFSEFARLILSCDKHYDFIIGEVRRCQTALPPRLVSRIVKRLAEGGVPEETVAELQSAADVKLVEIDPAADPLNNLRDGVGPGDYQFFAAWAKRENRIAAGMLPGRSARQQAPQGMAWEFPPEVTLFTKEFSEGFEPGLESDWLELVCDLDRIAAHQIRRQLRQQGGEDSTALYEFLRLRRICTNSAPVDPNYVAPVQLELPLDD